MKLVNPFDRSFWIDDSEVRAAVGPLPSRDAIKQAHYSAIALEDSREQLRADLMRQRRECIEERERIEAALDELDALRVLETLT